jgi:hypothetical protein
MRTLQGPTPLLTHDLIRWAHLAAPRQLYDLVLFGLVSIPLGFLGEPSWWLLATPPLGISALGGWGLLHRMAGGYRAVRLARHILAAVVFLAAVISVLGTFFLLLSPPPTL